MGVGKTERLGINTSRFGKGRRVDEANERILRKLKVKGGRIHKAGDNWVIEVSELTPAGSVGSSSGVGIGPAGADGTDGKDGVDVSSRCDDCCNYEAGCPEPESDPENPCSNHPGGGVGGSLSSGDVGSVGATGTSGSITNPGGSGAIDDGNLVCAQ